MPASPLTSIDDTCPQCERRQPQRLFSLESDVIVRCRECGLTYALSPPVDQMALYNDGYFSGQADKGGYQNYQAEFVSHRETFRRRLSAAADRLGRRGRLLDYGCAYGHLGFVASKEGWDVVVTDLSFDAVHRAVHEYGLLGFVSDLSHPPLRHGVFDLVALYDVIEHVRQPKSILRAIAGLLRPSGRLHLTTPDVGSWSAKGLGCRWYHYKPREHLLYFSRRTLRRLLESCGWEIDEVASAPSHMTIHDILVRLRRYSDWIASALLKLATSAGLVDRVVKIHIGEMQAWAKPPSSEISAAEPDLKISGQTGLRRLVPYLACPECQGELTLNGSETELRCGSCRDGYEIRDQIPILLPKKKPAQRAA